MFVSLKRALFFAALSLSACGKSQAPQNGASETLVTDVAHTEVKRQSIGNCWIYAHATWLESLLLSQTGVEANVSESYWTWWNWYDQIVGSGIDEVQTGGWWQTSAAIIVKHGFVLEGEFLADESTAEMSARQAAALAAINTALKPGGSLAKASKRTPAGVRKALDKAFGSKMKAAEALSRKASTTVVSKDRSGADVTLEQALTGSATQMWNVVYFPRLYGKDVEPTTEQLAQRAKLFQRVFKALNDKQPVVMSMMIDFNAVDTSSEDAVFKASTLKAAGVGHQGGHMVVLEDYSVNDAPGFGHIGYGDVSDEQKAAAAEGTLEMFKVKNSWGKDRTDRPWLKSGYTSFDAAYLTEQLPWKYSEESTADEVSYYTTLTDFVLPPGY